MSVARRSTSQLAGVLGSAIGGNASAALRSIGLEGLAGRPIEEIFLSIMEVICPDGGAIDDSIAREAFVETIVDLVENGITDFDALTAEQVQTILELNVAHAIEARICNDIGAHAISLPQDAREAAEIQAQLFEFVARAVSDAFAANQMGTTTITQDQVTRTIDAIYEQSYSILQSMAEAEVDMPPPLAAPSTARTQTAGFPSSASPLRRQCTPTQWDPHLPNTRRRSKDPSNRASWQTW